MTFTVQILSFPLKLQPGKTLSPHVFAMKQYYTHHNISPTRSHFQTPLDPQGKRQPVTFF